MADRIPLKILFLGKKEDARVIEALGFCKEHFSQVDAVLGDWGDSFPPQMMEWKGDLLVSYLSRWIVPGALLKNASMAAINFHPAPPEYPGIGCFNFALYDEVGEYGVTCHIMNEKVDEGEIISVKRFKVTESDDLESLMEKSYSAMLSLFYEVVGLTVAGEPFPRSSENWKRKPYTRRELDALSLLSPEMSREEMKKRIRATNFGKWKPKLEIEGFIFEYSGQKHE